jgi:hypothetical protein
MKTPAILVDIDGTIALRGDRGAHDHECSMEDAVNWPVVRVITELWLSTGWKIVLVTGRQEKDRDVTEYWLWRHGLFLKDNEFVLPLTGAPLFMRATGDQRKDSVVKQELYVTHVEPYFNVEAVFDDRDSVVKMWREKGLTCFQVAEGDF